jgi:hypothetical protein
MKILTFFFLLAVWFLTWMMWEAGGEGIIIGYFMAMMWLLLIVGYTLIHNL